MAKGNRAARKHFSFFEPRLLKVSFFFSLLVLLFLLLSFIFLRPENIGLANLVQKMNTFFSWPYNMLESTTHISLSWIFTALCILLFWFLVFYLVLLLFTFFKEA